MSLSRAPILPALALLLALAGPGCQCSGGGGPDGGVDAGADAGPIDAGPDGGTDAGPPDAGPDAGPDGGTDGGVVLSLASVIPVRGPAAGGTRVALSGRGFVDGFAEVGDDVDSRTAVLFGANTAVEFTVIDDDTIEVVVPPGVPGARDVRVQNPNGEAVCTGCFTYYTPVTASAVAPDTAPLSGGPRVTLTGTGLVEGTTVLVGTRAAADVRRVDDETLTFVVPPGAAAGLTDVVVFNANGRATLRKRFTYYAEARIDQVDPPVGPATGGTTVRVEGPGLGRAQAVRFGADAAPTVNPSGADAVVVTTPPGVAGTAVDLTVTTPEGEVTLPRGFAYVDPALRDASLLLVAPDRGPLAGGGRVVLVGTGLDGAGAQVRFGEADATGLTVLDASRLEVTVPPGAAAGAVDVQVRNDRGGARLAAGYRYQQPVEVASVSPASGPAVGGTTITVQGAGFAPGARVRVGALDATDVVVVSETTLTALTPPGSAGPNDVVVEVGAGADAVEGRLEGGFLYEDALTLAQVIPQRGAQAGGTLATITGTGFGPDLTVRFGTAEAVVRERVGRNVAVVYTPAGFPGLVDVTAESGGEAAVLTKAFQYYDPTNTRGGASGGPLAGTLDVTLLDSYAGAPIPGALVMLGADPATPFQGLTDARGQITFSDPSLVKPVTVTATKEGYEAVTASRLDARDLTLYLTPNVGESGPPPTFPPPGFIGGQGPDGSLGRVCGFKLPPDRVLGANQTEEARVYVSAFSTGSFPPFRSAPYYQVVSEDCGTFGVASRSGRVAVYAVYGIKTSDVDPVTGDPVESFEPILMGVTRGVEVPAVDPPVCTPNKDCPGGFTCSKAQFDPANPGDFGYCLCDSAAACAEGEICNLYGGCQPPVQADVVLSMHMDLDVPIHVVNPPATDGARTHFTYSYLELGGDGVAYIGETISSDDDFTFPRHPRLPGDGFVFLDMATVGGGYPLSLSYRRQIGDLAAGVDIGPMQPFTHFISPAPGGALTGGRVQWAYDGLPIPDVVQVSIEEPGFVPKPVWTIVLPGSETQVQVPPAVLELLRQSPALQLTLVTALSPRFDFDHFSYSQLGLSSWTSFTQDYTSFTVP